jgi:hypothetical protein
MARNSLSTAFRSVTLVVLGGGVLAGGLSSLGQNVAPRREAPPTPGGAQARDALEKYLVGAERCRSCHSHPDDYKKQADRLLCRMLEYPIWDGQDKHKIAYKSLLGDRGREMGERLGIKAAESIACTNCHGMTGAVKPEEPFDQAENGVSCVACHGAYKQWVQEHQFPDDKKWRQYDRHQKEQMFGMTDLWDPITCAEKCASCHIGNPTEQKVVTHAMYAAGHPPLPGLETATFSDAQPRHWQYLREKKTAAKKDLGYNPGKREQTELVVASGIVALGETMRLFAAEAREDGLVKDPESHWPDFARFDCYACHHDLQTPSWRQARGYGSRAPGRPSTPTWPGVLVELGIMVADPTGEKGLASEYHQKVEAFGQAAAGRPFGDRERAVAAAQALADWADAVCHTMRDAIEDPRRVAVDGPMVLRLLRELCRMAEAGPHDFDTARQIALAFRTIYAETRAIDPDLIPDPAIAELLADLDQKAHLSLPAAGVQEPIENTLATRLKAVFDFDPGAFQATFAQIARRLPPG